MSNELEEKSETEEISDNSDKSVAGESTPKQAGPNGKLALKSGIWYTISNFVSKGAVFITMPIFTRLMSTQDFGLFSNFSSWLSILSVIATLELFTSLSLAKYDFNDNINDYISSNLLLGTCITGVFYGISLCFKRYLLDFLSFSELEFHILFIYCLVCPAIEMFQVKSRIYYKYKASVIVSLISVLTSTVTSLLLVILFKNKYLGRYIGYICPLIALNIIIYVGFLAKGHKIKARYWKYALIISFPMVWHTLAGTILNSSDRVMITLFRGPDETALYSVAHTCTAAVSLLWNSMNAAWSPWAYDQMDTKNFSALKKASRPYILFFGTLVICFLLVAPELLWIFGDDGYVSAIQVIPPLMIAYVFQFVYSLYVNIEFYYKKQVLTAVGTIFAAGLNIALNLIFIPRFGYVAAAYTTLVGYICLFFVHFIIALILKKSFFYDTIFNMIFLLAALAIMFAMIFLYPYKIVSLIVRYAIIGVLFVAFIVVMIVFRKELLYLIKNRSFKLFRDRFKKNKDEA